MIFGDPDRFGIEFSLEEEPEGAWMLGHVCYWICGQRIGDYEQTVTLRDVMTCWFNIVYDAGKRTNDYLMSLDKVGLASLLFGTLFGVGSSDPAIENRATEEQWARHIIEPVIGYGFVGWKICLVESDSLARCVYHRTEGTQDQHYECHLKPGEFDAVLGMAIRSLEQQFASLSNSIAAS